MLFCYYIKLWFCTFTICSKWTALAPLQSSHSCQIIINTFHASIIKDRGSKINNYTFNLSLCISVLLVWLNTFNQIVLMFCLMLNKPPEWRLCAHRVHLCPCESCVFADWQRQLCSHENNKSFNGMRSMTTMAPLQ